MSKEELKKTSVSYTERSESTENKVPKGATIVSKTVSTSTEKIENGYLLIKSYDVTYKRDKDNNGYAYYSEKTYSKEDPMKKMKSIADAFKDNDDEDFEF